jgi:hypothetical protein
MASIAIPSLSQDATPESQCSDGFKRIDANNDGFLTNTEIPKAREMPPELAKAVLVGRGEFMAVCVKAAQAKLAEQLAKQQAEQQAKQADQPAASSPSMESPQGQTPPAK